MMSDPEMNARIYAVHCKSNSYDESKRACMYDIAVRMCQQHQFTAAAEGLLEVAERMVGIEREEKAS